MMPHTVPNRPTYGLTEPTEARNDEMRLELVHLALVGRAHRAARAVDAGRRRRARLRLQLDELAEAGLEDALQCRRRGGARSTALW